MRKSDRFVVKYTHMSTNKSEFYLALNQVATERGISPQEVVESIKTAVLAAYKKDYARNEKLEEGEVDPYTVEINEETGETKVFKEGKDCTPPGFGRIAAQTARQVILQKIREAEKKTIIKHYVDLVGTITKGRIIRNDGRVSYVDIGKTEGILPHDEQIRNENFRLNDTIIVYIKEIKEDNYGNQRIIVSRTDPKLVEELFKKEVPEIANGAVKISKIVRAPGERAKIAVFSEQSGVDPVGACVGQKGIRVKTVTDELGGDEKIDIIQFSDDDITYIREALSPATTITVEIDKADKKAKVVVEESQAPLAIGKNGVNVNLASKLTGYAIDIIQQEAPVAEVPEVVATEEEKVPSVDSPLQGENSEEKVEEVKEEVEEKAEKK